MKFKVFSKLDLSGLNELMFNLTRPKKIDAEIFGETLSDSEVT
jgi:hypothetical protein